MTRTAIRYPLSGLAAVTLVLSLASGQASAQQVYTHEKVDYGLNQGQNAPEGLTTKKTTKTKSKSVTKGIATKKGSQSRNHIDTFFKTQGYQGN